MVLERKMALGRSVRSMSLACAVFLVLLSTTALHAALDEAEDAEPPSATSCANVEADETDSAIVEGGSLTPPSTSGPTRVGVAFRVLELREIDPVQSSYLFRGYVRTSWCDRRHAFDRATEGKDERIYTGPAVSERLGKTVWYPAGFAVNQVGETRFTERILRIRYDGTVEQDMNINVQLASRFDLSRFPFDEQSLQLQLESFVYPSRQVEMVDDAARTGFAPTLQLPEWKILAATGSVAETRVMRSREPFSRYTLNIVIARKPGFYLWKAFLPLVVIVALSWSIFWMPEERFAQRSRITATGVLTIVAYQFAFGADQPRIGYLTLLDKTMILSFGLLAVTMLESLMISGWQDSDPERALGVDRLSRMIFPAVYAIGLLLILLLSP